MLEKIRYQNLADIITVYNRRKLVGSQRLVLDAPNDRVLIMEQYYNPDTGLMEEMVAATISRTDITDARTDINNARTIVNAFVTEVQALT